MICLTVLHYVSSFYLHLTLVYPSLFFVYILLFSSSLLFLSYFQVGLVH